MYLQITYEHYQHRCVYTLCVIVDVLYLYSQITNEHYQHRYVYTLCVIVDVRRRHYRRNLKDFSPHS